MFGSSIIDIAIGMVFIYLLLSLICSAAQEIIERYTRKRASDLENGIKEMLQSPALVTSLYRHPLVSSLFQDKYISGAKTLPSYIPARNFALALMDLAGPGGAEGATSPGSTSPVAGALDDLRASLQKNDKLPTSVKTALLTFVDSSSSPAKVRENIENWFDSAMDRVSGVYKRRTQLIVFLLGVVISILLNANSVTLVRTLSSDQALRDSLVAAAQEYAKSNPMPSPSPSPAASPSPSPKASPSPSPKASPSPSPKASPSASTNANSNTATASPEVSPTSTPPTPPAAGATATPDPCATADTPECRVQRNLAQIKKLELPIGWGPSVRDEFRSHPWSSLFLGLVGWLITALAISLGAPFWFDMLNKFIVVRSTVKPREKSPEEKSKD